MAANVSLSSAEERVCGAWGVLQDIDALPPDSVTARKYQALLDNLPHSSCSSELTWQGGHSVNWSDPCNWDKNRVPTISDDVVIPGATPFEPSVDMNGRVSSVKVALGAVLTVLSGWGLSVE